MSDIKIKIDNRTNEAVDTETISSLAGKVLKRMEISQGELGIIFIDDVEMARLNQDKMGRPGPTDVLSFPLDAEDARGTEEESGPPLLLGDVVICPEVASRQSAMEGTSFPQELCLLVIHGLLHMGGSDHEVDGGEMERLQNELFNDLCFG